MTSFRLTSSLLAFCLLAICSGQAAGQNDTVKTLPGIEITTSVDNATVYIGDLITYSISITRDTSYDLVPPPLGANLGAFDVKDYQPDIETKLDDGRIKSETIFKLSTFTTGEYVIPPVPIMFILKDRSHKVLLAEAVPITVQSLLQNTDDSADIKPLKAQYEFKQTYMKYVIWGGIVLLLLTACFGIWWWLRKRKNLAEAVDRRTPWEIAFEDLARLEQKNLIHETKFKQFYFELTDIARAYLGRMFSADVLEMTTEQFLDHFRAIELPAGAFDKCVTLLKHADLVKFAKLTPKEDRCRADFAVVHALIDEIRIHIEKKRAAEIAASQTPPSPLQPAGGARG